MNDPIRINPQLDARDFAGEFARDGRVQIPDFLTADSADRIEVALKSGTPWGLSITDAEGRPAFLANATLAAIGRDEAVGRARDALKAAAKGFGFSYLSYPVLDAALTGRDPGHPTHGLVELLNTPPVRDFCADVAGETGVTKIDAMASWFRPGDFLTLHNDTGVGERRAAYTIGMTRDWRTDWGGQLLFHDAAGDVTRGLKPGFNVMTLFRVPSWHSVATVAPYATAPRLSITGWLRDDPPLR